jgi:hypothetical protein
MDSIRYLLLIVLSMVLTGLAWSRILRKEGFGAAKLGYLVLAAIPVFGPLFYLMIDPPNNVPLDPTAKNHWKGSNRGNDVWPSFDPLMRALRRLFRHSNKESK